MNIADLGNPELQRMVLSVPSVAHRVPRFIEGAMQIMPEYIKGGDFKIEVHNRLSAVLIRDFFEDRLVDELTQAAQRRGFSDQGGGRLTTNLPADMDAPAVNAFRKVIAYGAEPGIKNVFVNRYQAHGMGGLAHIDTGARGVTLLGKNPGGVVISNTKIANRQGPSLQEIDRFDKIHHSTTRIDYDGGDVLFFDGGDRLHKGVSAESSPHPRFTFAGYVMRLSL